MIFPDRATAEACHQNFGRDPRWETLAMPCDGKRMIFDSFDVLFAEGA
ncbi:hypothetical protein [Sagittula salina]